MTQNKDILSLEEIETYVSYITLSEIENIGTPSWFEGHHRLHKLYQQAVLEATQNEEENVKEAILLHGKMQVLGLEIICLSVWKEKVFPELLKLATDAGSTFPAYTVLYHESTTLGLLQVMLYHSDSCESLQDIAVDVTDYCIHNITRIICSENKPQVQTSASSTEISVTQELIKHEKFITFDVGIQSISVLRYIIENLDVLPIGVTAKIYSNHDVPLLMCHLIECKPWEATDENGQTYKFIESNWKKIKNDEGNIDKTDAQVWLSLHVLLLDQLCLRHYEFNEFRRSQLIKLLKYLNDDLLDQLSPLIQLKQFLSQLSVSVLPPLPQKTVFIELISQHKHNLLSRNKKEWNILAHTQAEYLFRLNKDEIKNYAKRLSDVYDTLDQISSPIKTCSSCGLHATKRCSRCKAEWYCSRKCQLQLWPQHKIKCTASN